MLTSTPQYAVPSEFSRLQLKSHFVEFVVDAYPDAITNLGVAEPKSDKVQLGLGYVVIDGEQIGSTVMLNTLLKILWHNGFQV